MMVNSFTYLTAVTTQLLFLQLKKITR